MRAALLAFLIIAGAPAVAHALLISTSSRALVGGTNGGSIWDDGELDTYEGGAGLSATEANAVGSGAASTALTAINVMTGELKSYATATSEDRYQGGAYTEITLTEYLTVSMLDPGAIPSRDANITFRMPFSFDRYGEVGSTVGVTLSLRNCLNTDCNSGPLSNSSYSPSVVLDTHVEGNPTVALPIDLAFPRFALGIVINTSAVNTYLGPAQSMTLDFANTAILSAEIAYGYVFTSDSGLLLTSSVDNDNSVPEPPAILILMLSIAVLLWSLRGPVTSRRYTVS